MKKIWSYWATFGWAFLAFAAGQIGALAVAPSDPNVVYAGTGETTIRIDVSYGDGLYRSTDAGRTWKHIGLATSKHIPSLIVDPRNPNIVLAAARGDVHARERVGPEWSARQSAWPHPHH